MIASRVSVVIVNWNSGALLDHCLASLDEFGGDFIDRVIVVDNDSIDNSLSAATNRSKVTVIKAQENLGFARACNLGAKDISSEYLLFLNPDAAVCSGTIERVLGYMSSPGNESVGICGVRLVDESGVVSRSCARFPTLRRLLADSLGVARFIRGSGVLMQDWRHDQTRDVDHVIGAFFFMRRSLFKALQGFDERYFVYLEDLDFSFRARKLGWRTRFLAEISAFHLGGGASRRVKDRRLFYSLRSRILYSNKHLNCLATSVIIFSTMMVEPWLRVTLAARSLSWTNVSTTFRGYQMLWRWMYRWLQIKNVRG